MLSIRISSSILKTSIISLLLLAVLPIHAQSGKKNIEKVDVDTIPFFRGLMLSVDVVGLGQIFLGSYGQYEAALRVNIKDKYFPIIELGYGVADAEDITTNLTYETSAPYARAGVDFNIMKNKHDIYRIYAGFRYGFTSYKFDVTATEMTDPVWGDDVEYEANDVKANYHWLEGVAGVDAKIWGPVHLGWSVRYRRRLFHDDGELGKSWYVPGYGKQGGTRLGATFNVIIEI